MVFMADDDLLVDSSELLRSGNYSGVVREVNLVGGLRFETLSNAQRCADDRGFVMYNLGIVNVIHGEPYRNEPRPALLCRRKESKSPDLGSCLADAIIVREGLEFCFYEAGKGFRYVA